MHMFYPCGCILDASCDQLNLHFKYAPLLCWGGGCCPEINASGNQALDTQGSGPFKIRYALEFSLQITRHRIVLAMFILCQLHSSESTPRT